jgi:hypothetical protein
MCPACLASAAVLTGGAVSTGGITAVAMRVFGFRRKRSRKNAVSTISTNVTKRRKDDDYGDEQTTGNGRVAC